MRNRKLTIASMLLILLGVAALGFRWRQQRQGPRSADASGGSTAAKPINAKELMGFNFPMDAEAGTVAGRITDARGAPLPQASVVVMPVVVGREMWTRMAEMDVLASAMTDADGRYVIRGVRPGVLNVAASHVGFIPNKREPVTMMPGESVTGVDLQLQPGGVSLTGVLSDAGGGGIPGGKVWVVAIMNGEDESVTVLQAGADGDGKYGLSLAKGFYVIRALADGYDSAEEFQDIAADAVKNFKLNPAARIAGTVVDKATGKPVPDAQVVFVAERSYGMPRPATTNSEGKFTSPGLSPAVYRGYASKGALVGQTKASVAVHQAELQTLIIEVAAGHTLAGHVVAKDSKPIAGAKVTLWQESRMAGPLTASTDAKGAYRLLGIAPGKVYVQVSAETYARSQRSTSLEEDVSGFDFTLAPESTVKGKVVDAQGKPLEGAMVQAMSGSPANFETFVFAQTKLRTKADGRFEIGGLTPGKLDLMAFHPSHGRVRDAEKTLTASQALEVTLKFGGEASIAGVVRFDDGQPAKGAFVSAGSEVGDQTVTAGPDGRFTIPALQPGKWSLWAKETQDYRNVGNGSKSFRNVTLATAEMKTGVELIIKRTNKTIEGSVLDPDGRPAVGAMVGLMHSQGVRWGCDEAFTGSTKTTADDAGKFRLENIDSGIYGICARWAGTPDAFASGVKGGDKSVVLRFEKAGSMAGMVLDQNGKPQRTRLVAAYRRQPEEVDGAFSPLKGTAAATDSQTDPSGTFRLTGLRAGVYDVMATGADGINGVASAVNVQSAQETAGVQIRLAAGASITGQVVALEDGRPLAGVMVSKAGDHKTATTDGAGKFTLSGVVAGSKVEVFCVRQDPKDTRFESREVWIPAGSKTADAGVIKMPGDQGLPEDTSASTGLRVAHEGGHPVVTGMFEESPATKSGIKRRDLIISIDGRNVDDLGRHALDQLLTGPEGSSVTLRVQTANEPPRNVKIELQPR